MNLGDAFDPKTFGAAAVCRPELPELRDCNCSADVEGGDGREDETQFFVGKTRIKHDVYHSGQQDVPGEKRWCVGFVFESVVGNKDSKQSGGGHEKTGDGAGEIPAVVVITK